jgi:hypothetical protein
LIIIAYRCKKSKKKTLQPDLTIMQPEVPWNDSHSVHMTLFQTAKAAGFGGFSVFLSRYGLQFPLADDRIIMTIP